MHKITMTFILRLQIAECYILIILILLCMVPKMEDKIIEFKVAYAFIHIFYSQFISTRYISDMASFNKYIEFEINVKYILCYFSLFTYILPLISSFE